MSEEREEKMGWRGAIDEPAFPHQSRDGHETFNKPVWGLTKREYFAAAAMQGLMAILNERPYPTQQIAITSVQMADALIEELRKPKS